MVWLWNIALQKEKIVIYGCLNHKNCQAAPEAGTVLETIYNIFLWPSDNL